MVENKKVAKVRQAKTNIIPHQDEQEMERIASGFFQIADSIENPRKRGDDSPFSAILLIALMAERYRNRRRRYKLRMARICALRNYESKQCDYEIKQNPGERTGLIVVFIRARSVRECPKPVYSSPLKFPVSPSVYPLGKRTPVSHCRVFSTGLGIIHICGTCLRGVF
jgi:hypothetical protein